MKTKQVDAPKPKPTISKRTPYELPPNFARSIASKGWCLHSKKGELMSAVTTYEPIHKTLETHPAKLADAKYRWTISDGQPDRQRDTINPLGWDLTAYSRNPIVLWGHDYKTLPIGKSLEVFVRDGKLQAVMQFTPPGLHPLADQIRGLIDANFLVGSSVGMLPVEWSYNAKRDGNDFTRQQLLEWSIVSVPANAGALRQRCVGGRCDEKAIRKWLGGGASSTTGYLKGHQQHNEELIGFKTDDLAEVMTKVLSDEVQKASREVMMRLTGKVD